MGPPDPLFPGAHEMFNNLDSPYPEPPVARNDTNLVRPDEQGRPTGKIGDPWNEWVVPLRTWTNDELRQWLELNQPQTSRSVVESFNFVLVAHEVAMRTARLLP